MTAPVGTLLAVDIVLCRYCIEEKRPEVLLVTRKNDPFQGQHALPGGFFDPGDGPLDGDYSLLEAAFRELREETGINAGKLDLLGVYSTPDRDPRGRVVSAGYVGRVDPRTVPVAGDDAATAQWHPWSALPRTELAFDHRAIINDAYAYFFNN